MQRTAFTAPCTSAHPNTGPGGTGPGGTGPGGTPAGHFAPATTAPAPRDTAPAPLTCRGTGTARAALTAALALPLALALAPPAAAQLELEEVIVTAQKREQTLQDVPGSVAAVTQETLEKTVTNNFQDLTKITSGLTITGDQDGFGKVIRIRGVGTNSFVPAIRPAVGIFLNEIPLGAPEMAYNNLADIERIEVLKGPQATLFGKEVSSGAISLFTRRPNTEAADGYFESNLGNLGLVELRGGFNTPLGSISGSGDSVALRVSGYYNERDDYIDNATVPSRPGGAYEQSGFRAHLLLDINEDLSATLGYEQHDTEVFGSVSIAQEYGDLYQTRDRLWIAEGAAQGQTRTTQLIVRDPFDRVTDNSNPSDRRTDTDMWSLHVNWQINEQWSMTSITSEQGYELQTFGDQNEDGTADTSVGPYYLSDFVNEPSTDTFTQEFRFNFDSERWSSIIGLFYAETDTVSYTPFSTLTSILPAAALEGQKAQLEGLRPKLTMLEASKAPLEMIPENMRNAEHIAQLAEINAGIQQIVQTFAGAAMGPACVRAMLTGDQCIAATVQQLDYTISMVNRDGPYVKAAGLSDLIDDFEEWAIYTHNIYTIFEGFDLTFGLRYSEVEKTAVKGQLSGAVGPFAHLNHGLVPTNTWLDRIPVQNDTWDEFTGTLKLTYWIDDNMSVYGGWDRGFKAGGHNVCKNQSMDEQGQTIAGGRPVCPEPFKAEVADNFEVGLKAKLLDRTLGVNAAAFFQTYDDYQVDIADEVGIGNSVQNAAEVEIKGVEADVTWLFNNHLSLTANISYIDATWEDYKNAECLRDQYQRVACQQATDANGNQVNIQDLSGRPLNYSPEWSGFFSATWADNFKGWDWYVRGEVSYRDEQYFFPDLDPDLMADSYQLLNASVGLTAPNGDWTVTLWGKNLADEDYLISGARNRDDSQGMDTRGTFMEGYRVSVGEERTYGLTLRYAFE